LKKGTKTKPFKGTVEEAMQAASSTKETPERASFTSQSARQTPMHPTGETPHHPTPQERRPKKCKDQPEKETVIIRQMTARNQTQKASLYLKSQSRNSLLWN